jgi:hypothetical protein
LVAPALLIAHLGTAAPLSAHEGLVIDPQVRAAVAGGPTRVLLELRVPGGFRPEGDLASAEAVAAQRDAIEAARQHVLARLAGTRFSIARQFESVPVLALHIGDDALAVLEGMSDLVARVTLEGARPPSRQRGRPA